jgi:hypothetical protein
MSNQQWSWLLASMGIVGMFFIGKKKWEAFLWMICVECFWTYYAVITKQYGFILGSFAYGIVYLRNAFIWRRNDR